MTKTETINTRSTANIGDTVTQIICFKNSYKTTIQNILASKIFEDVKTTILLDTNGTTHYINKKKVNWFEVHGSSTELKESKQVSLFFDDGTLKTVEGVVTKINEFGWIKTSYGYFAFNNKNILTIKVC